MSLRKEPAPCFSGVNSTCPSARPFDEYLAQIASLPMPSAEQIEHFCRYVMGDHSWYKGLILRGQNFIFFLNPELGPGTNGEIPLNRQNFLRSIEYLKIFGYLDYRFGPDSHMDADNVPAILQEHGKVRCYPYLSDQSKAHDLIWHRNKDVAELVKGDSKESKELSHPDLDLIRQLLVKRVAWQTIVDEVAQGWSREKWMAANMLDYYESKSSPLEDYMLKEKAEYQAQFSEDEWAILRQGWQRIATAKAEERGAYNILNDREKAKIKATIEKMLAWLAEMRLRS
ncbi:hypothetical protein ACO0LD_30760 [Undibacterium sp. Ji83W]|uniref:hypothetical protein n=1 Tax=Undibacterium sp. Ji83W TaxID=3413043 RepID=UPI003BF2F46C